MMVIMKGLICIYDLYFTFFCRSDAGDTSGAEKIHKKVAELFKPVLADIVEKALGNDNGMNDEVLDNLLQRSGIFKGLIEMVISREKNDRAGGMSALYNLLTYLGNARSILIFC